ncbi:putative reverse transcriptase domain-containing protein [Tanacetum coccineum]
MCEPNNGYNWERMTGGRTGRGGGRTRGRSGDQGNGGIDGQGGQVGGQGTKVNDGVDGVPDFSTIIAQQLQNLLPAILAQGDVRNVTMNNDKRGCTSKEFLACNPKEYDGKGGAIVYTRWIEKMESVQDMSGCKENQKVKYTAGSFVGKALTWWNSQIHTRSQEDNVAMSWEDFKTLTREESYPVNEMQKLETNGESSRDRNVKDDNKRTRAGNAFATTTNSVRREYNGPIPKCVSCNLHHPLEIPCRACFNCGRLRHMAKDCRVAPRMVNQAEPSIKTRGNHPNHVVANNGGQGHRNNGNQARGRSFMRGGEEARQDPNIVTGTFTLNDHYARTLCDYGADNSFVSTTFIPILGIEPSDLGLSYEIEIASGKLVEIDKVIRGCKLEIEGHVFDINLIPFGSGSFDVIIGMDWLSNQKAKIICHEKVVGIPLLDGKVLRVIGERPEEKMRHLMIAKAKEQKQEEIVVVRYFPEVFPDDL